MPALRFVIKRRFVEKSSRVGRLILYDKEGQPLQRIYSLENKPIGSASGQDLAIPYGKYKIRYHKSPKFNDKLVELTGNSSDRMMNLYNDLVPYQRYVLCHWGNDDKDSEGCILFGQTFTPGTNMIGSSQATFKPIYNELRKVNIEDVPFYIVDEQASDNFEDDINGNSEELFKQMNAKYPVDPADAAKVRAAMKVPKGSMKSMDGKFHASLDQVDYTMEKRTKDGIKEYRENQKKRAESAENNSRVEMDALVSRRFAEPELWDTLYTSCTSLKDADSSFAISYPQSAGYINDAGDFIRIDKDLGDIQIVHRSGTAIKVDANGNVTIHSKGSLKQIVDGDMAINIKGALDISAKNIYMHSTGDMTIKADPQVTINSPMLVYEGSIVEAADASAHFGQNVKSDATMLAKAFTCM